MFADSFELAERIDNVFGAPCDFLATTRTIPRSESLQRNEFSGYSFLYVGRLARVKGIDVLLEAAKNLPHNCRLSIAGDGPLADLVLNQAKLIGGQVRVLGRVSDKELAQELMDWRLRGHPFHKRNHTDRA